MRGRVACRFDLLVGRCLLSSACDDPLALSDISLYRIGAELSTESEQWYAHRKSSAENDCR